MEPGQTEKEIAQKRFQVAWTAFQRQRKIFLAAGDQMMAVSLGDKEVWERAVTQYDQAKADITSLEAELIESGDNLQRIIDRENDVDRKEEVR
jgi:hypothetical protein